MYEKRIGKKIRIFLVIVLTIFFVPGIIVAKDSKIQKKEEYGTRIKDYRIGAGDVLNINVWKEPELTLETARVRTDGKLTFPLLGDLQAAGLPPMALKDRIETGLKDFVETPTVTVTLLSPESKKFYILGEVRNTGEYPILKSLTVMQAFALAGGFTEWASKKEILLFRNDDEKNITIKIDYRDIVKGDFSKNIPIRADDTVVVP